VFLNSRQANTSLLQSRRKAEAAGQAKTNFLAKASHEIRTPMNAIVGMAELIMRENIPPTVQEQAMSIKQAGANLLSIVNGILDFSKIESGKLKIQNLNYYLSSVVNDVINIIRMRILEKDILFIRKSGLIPRGLPRFKQRTAFKNMVQFRAAV
jgi:signal transduction histidine kinase